MKSFLVLTALLLVIASVSGDGDDNLQDIAAILDVPTDGVPTVDEAKRVFREKCLANANEEAWDHAKGAPERAKDCLLGLFNITVLQQEIEVAKPTGDLDEVFKKYCRKSPQFLQCTTNFITSIKPCLDEDEKANIQVITNIVSSLSEFVCFHDGDRIALFYAELGPECLTDHTDDIKDCVNQTISRVSSTSELSLNNIPSFGTRVEQCNNFRQLQRCIVPKLESCQEPTPSNIVDSLFNFIYKKVKCQNRQ